MTTNGGHNEKQIWKWMYTVAVKMVWLKTLFRIATTCIAFAPAVEQTSKNQAWTWWKLVAKELCSLGLSWLSSKSAAA